MLALMDMDGWMDRVALYALSAILQIFKCRGVAGGGGGGALRVKGQAK